MGGAARRPSSRAAASNSYSSRPPRQEASAVRDSHDSSYCSRERPKQIPKVPPIWFCLGWALTSPSE
eukprot:772534-Amphidinium_carterae.1